MYTSEAVSKTPSKEGYAPTPDITARVANRTEPSPRLWLQYFWDAAHTLSMTYEPTNENVSKSFACLFQSLAGIVPTSDARRIITDFLTTTREVQKTLISSQELKGFFTAYPEVYTIIAQRPYEFFNRSLKDSDSLFIWTYLLHAYYNLVTGSASVDSFNKLKHQYDRSKINKETWGNPIWALIHFCAYYSPDRPDQDHCVCYKAFLSCLRYCLPCPKCRVNLEKNLMQLDIDPFLSCKESLFDYTVQLHNLVNGETGKSVITTDEAAKIYAPYNQPLMQQNAKFY